MSNRVPQDIEIFGRDIHSHQLKYHDKEVLVSKEFTFDSAHHLHCYDGKCQNLHGHTYRLQVILRGKVDDRGIAIDFVDIKRIVQEKIIHRLDHAYLNHVLPPMNTTAENMVVWMYEEIHQALVEEKYFPRIRIEEIRLWETPTSFASITYDMMGAKF